MPDQSLSPAIIEARALCPSDVFEIETLEIRHPDFVIKKNTLEICFIVDTFAATGGYQTVAERVISQIGEIKSGLLEKYNKVKWSLMTISGDTWDFQTGGHFVNYETFLAALEDVSFTSSATHGEIYNPILEVVSNLGWSAGSSLIAKHVVYIGDTPNRINLNVTSTWTWVSEGSTFMSSVNNGFYTPYVGPWGSIADIPSNPLESSEIGDFIEISGFDTAGYNGIFEIIGFAGIVGRPVWKLPATYSSELTSNTITASCTYTRIVPSAGTPDLAIEALQDKNIVFNQLPTFVNANLTSIVTSTGGVSLSYAQLATNELVIENIIELLSTDEIIDSDIERIFIVNDTQPHSLPIETDEVVDFETRGFKLRFTGSGENGLQNLSITIDDIDRKVSQFVAKAKAYPSPVELVFRVYLSDDLSQQQNNPPTVLYLTTTSNSIEAFSGNATTIDVVNAPFPNAYYRLENFPLA
jgi:hypothetical protein